MRILLLVLILALTAGAQQPQPYEVNGMKLGSSFSEWKKGPGLPCEKWQPIEPDVISYACPDTTYAGAPVQEIVNFYQGRLLSLYLVVSHNDFINLRAAIRQKCGQPERTEQKAYPLDGITLTGEHNRWANGVTSINLAEFGPDRNHSVLFFSHIEIMAEKTRNNKKQPGGN